MALHTDLPIYRTGCELVQLAFEVQRVMPRAFKRSMGERIVDACMEMLTLMAMANATRREERAMHIRDLLKQQHIATVLLRVSHDSRHISHRLWAQSVELLDKIGKQANGCLRRTSALRSGCQSGWAHASTRRKPSSSRWTGALISLDRSSSPGTAAPGHAPCAVQSSASAPCPMTKHMPAATATAPWPRGGWSLGEGFQERE